LFLVFETTKIHKKRESSTENFAFATQRFAKRFESNEYNFTLANRIICRLHKTDHSQHKIFCTALPHPIQSPLDGILTKIWPNFGKSLGELWYSAFPWKST
jgi:hypothetical protein